MFVQMLRSVGLHGAQDIKKIVFNKCVFNPFMGLYRGLQRAVRGYIGPFKMLYKVVYGCLRPYPAVQGLLESYIWLNKAF